MVSLINHTQIPKFRHPFLQLHYPVIPHLKSFHSTKRRNQKHIKVALFTHSFGSIEVRRAREFENIWGCWCKHSEGEIELEADIMDFMEKSEKPSMFPTKRELIEAGRMDLVEAIKRMGGWYSLGWGEGNVEEGMDLEISEFQNRVEGYKESATLREQCDDFLPGNEEEDGLSLEMDSGSDNSNSLRLASALPSGPLIGLNVDEDAGIDGILSRLEKQRNIDLGIDLGKCQNGTPFRCTHPDYDDNFDTPKDVGTGLGEDRELMSDLYQKVEKTQNIEPKDWRTWSSQRAGYLPLEFEAAEISFRKIQLERDKDGRTATNEENSRTWESTKEINLNHIQTRLQHLEFEVNTALGSLRSKREKNMSEEAMGSSNNLHKLSDAWEFQENEFMNAQERLRSVKAKLAVLEGKRALAIINSQKTVDEKQKRIDNALKAFQLLQTTCIEWSTNSASEVLLVGSFDGWTTKRKMEKSRANVFSIYLKLYPGRYEIKFIVDGVWKVDPLRPIVNNNGHENNLLIVT